MGSATFILGNRIHKYALRVSLKSFSDTSLTFALVVVPRVVRKIDSATDGRVKQPDRVRFFQMTQFNRQTKGASPKQLDESLQRRQVDHVDLWQSHENIRLEDPDRFFAEGGAAEATIEAKRGGKTRYVGFTGHKNPSVHLRMLEMAHKHNFQFDTVQMPINVMDAHFRSFEKEVAPALVQKQIAHSECIRRHKRDLSDKVICGRDDRAP